MLHCVLNKAMLLAYKPYSDLLFVYFHVMTAILAVIGWNFTVNDQLILPELDVHIPQMNLYF